MSCELTTEISSCLHREHVFELPLPCLSKENIVQCVREKVDKGRIHVLVQEGPNGEQFEIPIEMSRLVRCGTLSNSKKVRVCIYLCMYADTFENGVLVDRQFRSCTCISTYAQVYTVNLILLTHMVIHA